MTINFRLINSSNAQAWQSVIMRFPHSIMHTYEYNKALAMATGEKYFLLSVESGTFQAIAPLFVRVHLGVEDLYSPYGNSGGLVYRGVWPKDLLEKLQCFLQAYDYVTLFLKVNYIFCADLPTSIAVTQHKKAFVIDLKPSLDDIYQSLGRNNRRLLRQWHKSGRELICEQSRLRQAFNAMYPVFCLQCKADSIYVQAAECVYALKNNTYFVGVSYLGKIESVRVYFYTSLCADAYLEANLPGVRENSRILYWHAITHFKALGVSLLNLGQGIEAGDSLERFKKSLANSYHEPQTIPLIIHNSRYQQLLRQTSVVNRHFFPAYITVRAI